MDRQSSADSLSIFKCAKRTKITHVSAKKKRRRRWIFGVLNYIWLINRFHIAPETCYFLHPGSNPGDIEIFRGGGQKMVDF